VRRAPGVIDPASRFEVDVNNIKDLLEEGSPPTGPADVDGA
jgi:hypothetical protein